MHESTSQRETVTLVQVTALQAALITGNVNIVQGILNIGGFLANEMMIERNSSIGRDSRFKLEIDMYDPNAFRVYQKWLKQNKKDDQRYNLEI